MTYKPYDDPSKCPSVEQLLAFIEGVVTQEPRDQMLSHLSACSECATLGAISSGVPQDPPADEVALCAGLDILHRRFAFASIGFASLGTRISALSGFRIIPPQLYFAHQLFAPGRSHYLATDHSIELQPTGATPLPSIRLTLDDQRITLSLDAADTPITRIDLSIDGFLMESTSLTPGSTAVFRDLPSHGLVSLDCRDAQGQVYRLRLPVAAVSLTPVQQIELATIALAQGQGTLARQLLSSPVFDQAASHLQSLRHAIDQLGSFLAYQLGVVDGLTMPLATRSKWRRELLPSAARTLLLEAGKRPGCQEMAQLILTAWDGGVQASQWEPLLQRLQACSESDEPGRLLMHAAILLAQGHPHQAAEQLEQIAPHHDCFPEATAVAGWCYWIADNPDKARLLWHAALTSAPGMLMASTGIEMLEALPVDRQAPRQALDYYLSELTDKETPNA